MTATTYRTEQQFDDLLRECAEMTAEMDRLRNDNGVLQGLFTHLPRLAEGRAELLRLFFSEQEPVLTVAEHRELLRANRRWKVSTKILAIAWCVAFAYGVMSWWGSK